MNKEELIDAIAKDASLSKAAAGQALNSVLNAISGALAKGDKVTLVGFGTFETRERAAREGRNPQTGATIQIAAKKVPVWTPGKALKDSVSK